MDMDMCGLGVYLNENKIYYPRIVLSYNTPRETGCYRKNWSKIWELGFQLSSIPAKRDKWLTTLFPDSVKFIAKGGLRTANSLPLRARGIN